MLESVQIFSNNSVYKKGKRERWPLLKSKHTFESIWSCLWKYSWNVWEDVMGHMFGSYFNPKSKEKSFIFFH